MPFLGTVGRPDGPNRLSAARFIVAFGVVSLLADFVYEGARSIVGPYLGSLGASAALVGLVTGAGEAVALVLRLATGVAADRSGRHWALSIAGYAITVIAVPLLAVAQGLLAASALVIGERFGKAVRTPARDAMLAGASLQMGRGKGFALHEALDQTGALGGPLLVALMVAISGYRLGFAVLAIPAALSLLMLARLRARVPNPAGYAPERTETVAATVLARLPGVFWRYAAFTALSVAGFATFGVVSFHLQHEHVVAPAVIPLIYAAAMGTDALGALASGLLYDRIGLRGLVLAPLVSAAAPVLFFTTDPALVWAGTLLWGMTLGVHESTMRAAVADLTPTARRGTGYGLFTAVYGLAWFGGSTALGAIYDASIHAAILFSVALQALALVAFLLLGLHKR